MLATTPFTVQPEVQPVESVSTLIVSACGGNGGGGEGGGGEGGGGEGASNTCDVVPTPLTEVMVTPRLAESWAVLPSSADIDVWEEASDGTMMET